MDPKMSTALRQLRAFCHAARPGNTSRAAERVFCSQPAVSMQIRAPEQEFNTALVERNHHLVRGVSESLAGRVEFIELAGFDLAETGVETWMRPWLRGGFPRSYLAAAESNSMAWREGFVRTFLERDIPQLGITIRAAAMRRFWTMLAHWHGQTWNASELGRAMSLTDKTVRSYLDLLTGTYMVRQL